MSTLERAVQIAAQAHAGRVDKGGNPYLLHPLRVMLAVDSIDERTVAVLHDVVEDTDWTIDALRAEGFSEAVLRGLQSVTKLRDADGLEFEDYFDFVKRAAADPIGRKVKLADMIDNSDLRRISMPSERDLARVAKYRQAIELVRALPG